MLKIKKNIHNLEIYKVIITLLKLQTLQIIILIFKINVHIYIIFILN